MAEMADLTKALDKLEVDPKASSPQKEPHQEESTYNVSASAASPLAEQQSEESKTQEAGSPPKASEAASPPGAAQPEKPTEQEASPPPESTAVKDPSPPKPQQSEGSKDPSPPESKSQDPGNEDLLEFTSATEGEASSSAWEMVPEKKIARKKGVKSDTELDSMMKKVIKEAESSPPGSSAQVTAAASSSSKEIITPIAEESPPEAEAEKTPSEPDFSFEDGPEPSKEAVTSTMGRKNLMTAMDIASDDAEGDKEMVNVDLAKDHPASGKRKGRPASHSAKKRALPPKSPRTSSAGAKPKSPPPSAASSSNKMPRSASPQAKAESKVTGKPPVKPPPKGVTPLTTAAVAKPPPKSITAAASAAEQEARAKATAAEEKQAKLRAEREAKALADWHKAQEKVAERQAAAAAAAPMSPPMFTTDWSKVTSREDFLKKTSDAYRLDPNSAEGFNHHVSSYYYFSSDWGVSHPQSYSSLMLKSDSRQSHRWTCVHCRLSHPDVCDHKTVEAGIIHWWQRHSHHSSWLWCEKAGVFNVTTSDVCKAVLDVDMSERPLPLGGAFHMLPNNLPSHPRGTRQALVQTSLQQAAHPLPITPLSKAFHGINTSISSPRSPRWPSRTGSGTCSSQGCSKATQTSFAF